MKGNGRFPSTRHLTTVSEIVAPIFSSFRRNHHSGRPLQTVCWQRSAFFIFREYFRIRSDEEQPICVS